MANDHRPKPRLSEAAAGRLMGAVAIALVVFAIVAGRVLGFF